MGRSFTRDIFRYSPLRPGGGRASRNTIIMNLSLAHIFAITMTLLFVATASFFAGRRSLTDLDKQLIQRESARYRNGHITPFIHAAETSDYKARDIQIQSNLWRGPFQFQ